MPAPYSVDLRWRIVHACERGGRSQREVAELFQVSLATVENVLRLYRRTGDVAPKAPEFSPKGLLDPAAKQQLVRWVDAQPDVMLAELQARFARQCNIAISRPSLCRILQHLGLRRKKRRSMRPSATRSRSGRRESDTAGRSADIRAGS